MDLSKKKKKKKKQLKSWAIYHPFLIMKWKPKEKKTLIAVAQWLSGFMCYLVLYVLSTLIFDLKHLLLVVIIKCDCSLNLLSFKLFIVH